MLDKEEVLGIAKTKVLQKISELQHMFDDLSESLTSSTKSSAGDKHETSRSMTQLEQEKLGQQLYALTETLGTLDQIDVNKESSVIEFGSLVHTTNVSYLISTGLGTIDGKNNSVYCISATSPLGNALSGKKAGDTIIFQGKQIEITEVL